MKFLARFQAMADSEILRMIPAYKIDEIKATDSKPMFRAYIIGHEGEAKATWLGVGQVVKTWFSDAVKKLANKITGLEVFRNHADTNAHEGRAKIGEVVGSKLLHIKDKLSAIAAIYIYPDYRDLKLDVASIEADVNIDPMQKDGIGAVDIKDVTGIALGNSTIDKPGFANATLLGELQAFVNRSRKFQFGKGDAMKTHIDELKEAIKEEKLDPSDLFDEEKLTRDPIVKSITDGLKKKLDNEYVARKRNLTEINESQEEADKRHKKEKEDLISENKGLKLEAAKVKSGELFAKKITDRRLDERQKKFIETKRPEFQPQDPASIDKEVDSFMDKALLDFKATAEIFGIKSEEPAGEHKGGSEPAEGAMKDANFIPD